MPEFTKQYFAYGNNMHPDTMADRIGDKGAYQYAGRARLTGFRLSFTTRTPEWKMEPVSDLTRADRFAVYGVLYDMTEEAFEKLAPHEPTYERMAVLVDVFDDEADLEVVEVLSTPSSQVNADVYAVKEDEKEPEGVPHAPYHSRVLEAARIRKLPSGFVEAVSSLARGSDGEDKRVALPTRHRGQARPFPVAQLGQAAKRSLQLGKYAIISYKSRSCLAEVHVVESHVIPP